MLKLKRWIPVEYRVGSETIQFTLKRLRNEEAAPLLRAMTPALHLMATVTEATTITEMAEILAKFRELIPHDLVSAAFRDYVKDVKGIEDEDGPVTTGEQLYDFADGNLILFVITMLQQSSALSDKEGKASAGPSTSETPGLGSDTSSSPAPSIEDAAGAPPSTATVIPTSIESSSAQA